MKEFPPKQIESTRKYFKDQGFQVEQMNLGRLEVSYFVIPQALNPKLKDFALRMTTTNPETHEVTGIFGVSDSVPLLLRPFWAAHEIIEFTKIGIAEEGRCRTAEEHVLELVPPGLREIYIDRRTTFFDNLTKMFQTDIEAGAGNYTDGDLREAEATLQFLQEQRSPKSPA